MRLKDKVAVITGAAQGIGKAIATRFAAEGASVVIGDINLPLAEETAASINAQGGTAVVVHADVSIRAQVEELVSTAIERFGQLDIMVNNAGIIIRNSVLETSEEDWNRVFSVNVNGTFFGTVAAARHMVERGGGGHILNLASPNAIIGAYNRSCYAATKGAIESYTRCCAVELGQYGIQVNAIAPGFTATEINAQFFTPEVLSALEFRLPISRVAQPEEIAAAALAIVGGDMSFMVGQIVRVDGGWTACDVDYAKLGKYIGSQNH
ncbi:MAG: glucose 1-dehydrogenase [Chloroflexi bacterium]|nr:MAG: glucose 1-dehydrogenase [Chloroflexota bacterium]